MRELFYIKANNWKINSCLHFKVRLIGGATICTPALHHIRENKLPLTNYTVIIELWAEKFSPNTDYCESREAVLNPTLTVVTGKHDCLNYLRKYTKKRRMECGVMNSTDPTKLANKRQLLSLTFKGGRARRSRGGVHNYENPSFRNNRMFVNSLIFADVTENKSLRFERELLHRRVSKIEGGWEMGAMIKIYAAFYGN